MTNQLQCEGRTRIGLY